MYKGIAILLTLLCLLGTGCQGAPMHKSNTPTDVVRSFLIAVKNRRFEEADTYLLGHQDSYLLLSAQGIFKETQDFHFSEDTLKKLDESFADYIFSLQAETIQDQSATVYVSINSYDMKHTFDLVKSKIFDDAKEADTPLDAITLDTQVDPVLNKLLKNGDHQRMNTGLRVYLVKKDHRWLIDNNSNQGFFNALIGK
jgi:hypothetical protein